MAQLKEEAQAYEPPQTLNIADLEKVPIDAEVHNGDGKDSSGETYKYKYVEFNGEKYRVPGKVLGDIKTILVEKPDAKFFKVKKEGTGLTTKYTVMDVD